MAYPFTWDYEYMDMGNKIQQLEGYKSDWRSFLSTVRKVVVFDTETSGLDPRRNVMLSLSWQVLDGNLECVSTKTHFFDWPENLSMISLDAIRINGLTKERLAELGTSDKSEALREFMEDVKDADLLIAHNGKFDKKFILADANREKVDVRLMVPTWDTMVRMTEYCAIPGYYDEFKWPKLIELAQIIGVKTDDIDWHQSASDVEVTARCFREIAGQGLVEP